MPTYEYRCGKCESSYDLQESFSAPNKHRCKECKRGTAKRVLTPPTIVFKGSGFYATDNKGSSTLASASSSADSASSDDSSGSESESTPEPKPAKSEKKSASTTVDAAADAAS